MSDMVPEVLNAALDSLFTPKEPGEREYQGEDGLLYCRSCHTPVQCRVKLWGRDKIVPCLCRCQQEAMAEKKRQDELVERQRKIRQLKATGIQEKHLLEWNFAVAEDNKDTQIFLYKFLNDKFGYEIKKMDSRIASAEKWETAYSELPEDDRLDLLDSLSPDIPRLYPEHLISTLWNQQAKGDFDLIFDSTMVDIADKNIDIFSTQTTKNTKIPLFEKLTNFVTDDAQRAPFARALVDKLVNFSFEDAFAESYDFFAGVFEYGQCCHVL